MATEWAKAITSHESFSLVGVLSRNVDRARFFAERFSVAKVAQSVSELFDSTQADVVFVAVSEPSLRELFPSLIHQPWVRVVEKPAGINLEESIELAEASIGLTEPTYVALNRRFYSSTMTLLEQVGQEAGNRVIQINDQHDTEYALASGRDPRVVRNWMYANAIHTVDLFRVFGRGRWCVETIVRKQLSSEGFAINAALQSSQGDFGFYTSLWNMAGPWSVACHTRQYFWEMRPLERLSRTERLTRKVEQFHVEEKTENLKPGLWQFLEDLISANKQEQSRLVTLAEGLDSVRLVDEIYQGANP